MVTLAALLGLSAHAAEDEPGPKPRAVQNRIHSQRHEYGAWLGVLPMDAFTKGVSLTAAYTLHFSDLIAWEVGQFTYSFGIDTRLEDELAALPQPIGPTPFETVRFYATSNVVFKPIYGKLAVLNKSLVYQEIFFVLGGGAGALTVTTRPVVDFGLGARIYAGKHVSFRLDVRDHLFIATGDLQNELWFGLGFALGFGGT